MIARSAGDTGSAGDDSDGPEPDAPDRVGDLREVLAHHPPFDTLNAAAREEVAVSADVRTYPPGELVLDAFADATPSVYVIVSGTVGLWNEVDRVAGDPDETVGVGAVFGFSAMLSERTVGPRAVALTRAVVARLSDAEAVAVFATSRGTRFLARTLASSPRLAPAFTFTSIDNLIGEAPLIVDARATVADVAREMTDGHRGYAVVAGSEGPEGSERWFGLVTDALLRRRVVAEGVPTTAQIGAIAQRPPPRASLGESPGEVFVRMLADDADAVIVTDGGGRPQGVATLRDFILSPVTTDVSVHEQLRRAQTVDDLVGRARQVPDVLAELLAGGMATARVVAVNTGFVDTIVRRSIELTVQRHEGLSTDAFTWMALGSNGRREAVLSSDVDSAVAFADDTAPAERDRYRVVFGEIEDVLRRAGLTSDGHGATAHRPAFSRTHAQWRAAARTWLADPIERQGAMMTSLLLDGRPIYGDPGMPAVVVVFRDIREHPGTLRLLLDDALSVRPRLRSVWETLRLRPVDFDIKRHALLPLVNLARWSALSVRSPASSTVERLKAAAGSSMLPDSLALTLIEVFEVLQRLRLRYQLMQYRDGERPSDRLTYERMSPIDRSVVAQAVREISHAQRRLANVAAYAAPEDWLLPEPT